MKIWKWELDDTDLQTVTMPFGAKILDVQMQKGVCCIWALCNPDEPYDVARRIAIYGTGNPIPDNPGEYIATFQTASGSLVFHAFEVS